VRRDRQIASVGRKLTMEKETIKDEEEGSWKIQND
jgi:hypothetical protein